MDIVKSIEEYDAILLNNKGVFVDFYADWCGPCKMIAPLVEELAEEHPTVKFIKVNVDDTPDIASRYGITSIPTIIVFKGGKPASQTTGFQPIESLEMLVRAAE